MISLGMDALIYSIILFFFNHNILFPSPCSFFLYCKFLLHFVIHCESLKDYKNKILSRQIRIWIIRGSILRKHMAEFMLGNHRWSRCHFFARLLFVLTILSHTAKAKPLMTEEGSCHLRRVGVITYFKNTCCLTEIVEGFHELSISLNPGPVTWSRKRTNYF